MQLSAASLGIAVVALLIPSAAGAAAAAAAQAGEPKVEAVGACPEAGAVRGLLAPLVSATEADDATVIVQDRGPRFRIAVGATATMLDDPARDCAVRAQEAAIFAALVTLVVALAIGLAGVRCGRDVPLGVDPGSDAAAVDAGDGG